MSSPDPSIPVVYRELDEVLAYIQSIYLERKCQVIGFTIAAHMECSTMQLKWGKTRVRSFNPKQVFVKANYADKTQEPEKQSAPYKFCKRSFDKDGNAFCDNPSCVAKTTGVELSQCTAAMSDAMSAAESGFSKSAWGEASTHQSPAEQRAKNYTDKQLEDAAGTMGDLDEGRSQPSV